MRHELRSLDTRTSKVQTPETIPRRALAVRIVEAGRHDESQNPSLSAHGRRRLRGFVFRRRGQLRARGREECLGRRRRHDGGGRQPRQGRRLRLPRRKGGLEQQALLGGEDRASASAGVEQDEGRGDAWATVADDESVRPKIGLAGWLASSFSPDVCPVSTLGMRVPVRR